MSDAHGLIAVAKPWKPPRTNLPELPPELWTDVLRAATWVPQLLDPDHVVDFCPSASRSRRRLLNASLVTKRHVVRVCKLWNSLATPYLYESISIGRGRAISTLYATLQGSLQKGNPTNGHSLGWWTRRFDIATRDQGCDVEDELEWLSKIVVWFPNLNTLTFRVTAQGYEGVALPGSFLQNLAQSSGPNLRAVLWYNDTLVPMTGDWYSFLVTTGNIRTIYCPTPLPFWEDALLALHSLHTVYIPIDTRTVEYPVAVIPSLESLRRVIFNVDTHAHDFNNSGWKQLLRRYGEQLKVIQAYFDYSDDGITSTFEVISRNCPHLHQLDISVRSWETLRDGISIPTAIHTLGMSCMHTQAPTREYVTLFNTLANVKFGPALKVIQFLDQGNVTDLCRKHRRVLLSGLRKLSEMGLEVQGHDGQLLN